MILPLAAPGPEGPLLTVEAVTKAFPGVIANDHVDLKVARRSIHALLGENGAGKSTLVKMIYGVMRPDAGAMRLKGSAYAPRRPSEARAAGVGMVFQHFSLFDALTVAENIALGLDPGSSAGDLVERIGALSDQYGFALDPGRLVGTLSVGERQRVEIVRSLLQEPDLLIMDEPTSVLTPQEAEALFITLRRLAWEGRGILYISHKLEEVRALCDAATVLRGGRVVATCDPRNSSARQLAEMMIGSALKPPERKRRERGPVRLKVEGLSVLSEDAFGVDLADIALEVAAGEVLGIAGVAGNGQNELLGALTGEQLAGSPEAVVIDGVPAGLFGPAGRRRLGLASVPEERLGHSAVPDMTLAENVLLTDSPARPLTRSGFIDRGRAARFAEEIVARFDVRTAGVDHAARSLSGGNLQKFVVGREIVKQPAVLVVSQPTWGVDAGAAAAIHVALLGLAEAGAAVLVISQDLDELLAIADRIAVIAGGRLAPAHPIDGLTAEALGLEMGGSTVSDSAAEGEGEAAAHA